MRIIAPLKKEQYSRTVNPEGEIVFEGNYYGTPFKLTVYDGVNATLEGERENSKILTLFVRNQLLTFEGLYLAI